MIRPNRVKAMLKRGEVALGTFVRTTSPPVVEVLGLAGFDFVIIDNEHSPVGLESTANLIRAADGVNIVPIVRVMTNAAVHIMRALDARHPGYGFARNKGYPTPEHLAALGRLGPAPVHRRSFAPVAQLALV